jgi:hypothetical protein
MRERTIGQIVKMISSKEDLRVYFKNWEEKKFIIIFEEVIGYVNYSAEGEDVAEVKSRDDDNFIKKVLKETEEKDFRYSCYIFKSAWTDRDLLKVVCKGYLVKSGS